MSTQHTRISAYSNREQGVYLVLYALREGGGSKQEVIGCITNGGWYYVDRHDLPPYEGRNEPRYHTLLAWARKDCYERDWMLRTDLSDDWSLSREGRAELERVIECFRKKERDVRRCYLWKPTFKKLIDPTYVSSQADAVRPPETFGDCLAFALDPEVLQREEPNQPQRNVGSRPAAIDSSAFEIPSSLGPPS